MRSKTTKSLLKMKKYGVDDILILTDEWELRDIVKDLLEIVQEKGGNGDC